MSRRPLAVMSRRAHGVILAGTKPTSESRHAAMSQEITMERTDWLQADFSSAEARFLMVTAITHHRFSSRIWGEPEVLKLYAELEEIERACEDRSSHETYDTGTQACPAGASGASVAAP